MAISPDLLERYMDKLLETYADLPETGSIFCPSVASLISAFNRQYATCIKPNEVVTFLGIPVVQNEALPRDKIVVVYDDIIVREFSIDEKS